MKRYYYKENGNVYYTVKNNKGVTYVPTDDYQQDILGFITITKDSVNIDDVYSFYGTEKQNRKFKRLLNKKVDFLKSAYVAYHELIDNYLNSWD